MTMEETTILRCLDNSVSDYEDIKDSHSGRRVGETCLWFLNDETYKTWFNQGTQSVLLFSAGPGSGKSVLAAFLVDELKRHSRSGADYTVCYFFFQDSNYKSKTVTSALCALLLQLFDEEPGLLAHAVKQYQIKGQKFVEEFNALRKIFALAVQYHPRNKVICVIDGLDECEETDRDLLIDYLVGGIESGLFQYMDTHCRNKLKFFVTSRSSDTAAVDKEIALVVESEVSELGSRMNLSVNLQNTLKERFISNAGHTFLWVSLTLDQFRIRKDFTGSERQCWAILDDLPADLDAAYEMILQRSTNRRLARIILHIVIAAARPLALAEIGIALAIDKQSKSTEDLLSSRLPSIESSIQDICGGFVKIVGSQPNQKIDLVHQTAREFLIAPPSNSMPRGKGLLALTIWAICSVCFPTIYSLLAKFLGLWKHSLDPVEANRVLAEICVIYLFFEEFGSCPLVMDRQAKALDVRGTVDRYVQEYEFLDYAATHWAEHFREAQNGAGTALMESALELCDTKSKRFQTWFMVYWAVLDSLWPYPENLTNLMVGSFCGHKTLVQMILENEGADVAAKDGSGKTALIWAVEKGHKDVAQVLITNGADVNAKDMNEWTALHTAVANGYGELAELLRANHANVTAVTQRGHSALHFAARDGHHDIVGLLLGYGIGVDMRSAVGEIGRYTALHLAAMNGHKEVARLLLEKGADANAKTGLIGENLAEYAPLHFAVIEGHTEVTKLLLDNRAQLAARDTLGETPLHKLASTGHEQVVDLLLRKANRTDIEAKTKNGETPLHKAVRNKKHEAVVCLLLNENASIAAKDKNGALPLHYAAASGHEVAVRQLINLGAELTAQDDEGKSALHYAARCHNDMGARLLIEKNVDIAAQDAEGRTVLHDAAINGNEDLVALLLSEGANPCVQDKNGKTALHYAVANGREAVVKLLLANHNVDPNSRDKDGRTPLSWAFPNHHRTENVVKLMLGDERISPDSRDKNGRTPLSWAIQHWYADDSGVDLLLKSSRVDPDSRDKDGRTPLSWATGNDKYKVVDVLLDTYRVQPDSPDNNGRTPLSWAAGNDNANVVELLLRTRRVQPDSPDKNGRTPLSWAAGNENLGVVDLLLGTRRVQPASPDKNGRTPLSWAAGNGCYYVTKALLAISHVTPDAADKDGRTPISWATEKGHDEVVNLLIGTILEARILLGSI
ncbi:FabD/lysophospholipase-like protein [Penicillium cinerascens]|uniref:FabD/lysophospholipase-like protein n=1 Tax=Penicillium cinerascens TaxID=70096 RepID=A0A9W9NFW3_9EURO|nr:FabD/lysophospholipase-like protein [Penicillium cinerascens]KAJ5219205.1 FabD/lysophospholipase-like protein [Penicillium cinerascens]